MTLGDKPDLSIHAHPITGKVWMTLKGRPYGQLVMSNDVDAEIFEDGYVIFFKKSGERMYSQKYNSQDSAIKTLQVEGWKLMNKYYSD